ncbi:DUF927 domain-containing protein [Deefgea sp. CFH1-16]|uniref:DUF927 domain-containing protein n=1 Tax=Deefgea sp. CFH1-16 TaxID=2675457 RepID=UPI0015F45591|nr:DUF927 domain-containing protein [Deefgea sp. CFH1-16]MBM5575584.1 DUF927 domain-containing protein [Deefgea sp. CFH1-16]
MNGLGFAVSAGSGERVNLANYLLQGTKNKPRFDVLSMSGWNQGNFVLPTGEIIGDAKRNIFFNGSANLRGGFTPRGSLQGWNDGVCSLARNNPLVMVVMGLAFSGAILELIDAEEGIGMHLYTETSSGKTTCADVAASVWGHPKRLKKSWDATPISLTNSAQAANSMMMYTDEIGAGDTRRLGKVIYATINGQSRGRGLAGGGNEETKSWLNSLLSTGELGINQFITEAGEQVKGGQEIRMLDVPADGGLYRAFDCIHDYMGADVFAKELATQARRDCGNAGRAFVEWLINNQAQVKSWVTKTESRLLAELPSHAAPLVRRATRKFGIIAAALEMAGEAGATPFAQEEAFDATRAIWRRWLAVFGTESRDDNRLIDQANAILAANQMSPRFVLLANHEGDYVGEPVSVNMMGYKRIQADGDIFYILPHAFKDEIAKGFEPRKACKILHEAGMLERAKGHDGWTVVIARKKGRGYKMKLKPCKNPDETEL